MGILHDQQVMAIEYQLDFHISSHPHLLVPHFMCGNLIFFAHQMFSFTPHVLMGTSHSIEAIYNLLYAHTVYFAAVYTHTQH